MQEQNTGVQEFRRGLYLDFGQNYTLECLILFEKITFQNSII